MSLSLNGVTGTTPAKGLEEIENLRQTTKSNKASGTYGAAQNITDENDLVSFEEEGNGTTSLVDKQDPELQEDGIQIIIELPDDKRKGKGKDKIPPPPPPKPDNDKHKKRPGKDHTPPPPPPKPDNERPRIIIRLDEENSNVKDLDENTSDSNV